jgi:hypothetical protein
MARCMLCRIPAQAAAYNLPEFLVALREFLAAERLCWPCYLPASFFTT